MPASSRAKKFAAPAQTAGSYGTLFQMISAGSTAHAAAQNAALTSGNSVLPRPKELSCLLPGSADAGLGRVWTLIEEASHEWFDLPCRFDRRHHVHPLIPRPEVSRERMPP
jgi:hypothetical protein